MEYSKKVYKNPQPGVPLMSTISTGCKTPIMEVKFCNLINPYYYPNSPKIPRYSITCAFDPDANVEFIEGIQAIENREKVETIIKCETEKKNNEMITTGNLLIKFQGKDLIPVFVLEPGNKDPIPVELEDELAQGERVMIIYDILRYTKKNTLKTEHGLSFKPTCIYYYPNE